MKHVLRSFASCALLLVPSALALGCRGQTSREPQIVAIRNMFDQPRYDMQATSAYFSDGRTMRPQVEGTISREQEIDPIVSTGRDESGAYVLAIPDSVVQSAGGLEELAVRGHGRFDIYCAPCHARDGYGNTVVVHRGMQAPPSFHSDRLRQLPDGQVFATASNGIRNMPSYRAQIPISDRWAIVAYLRALQLSQVQTAQGTN